MKLLLGKVLIETDYIETVDRLTAHTVKITFASGSELQVVCGIKTDGRATWEQDADGLIQTILNTDTYVRKVEK